MPLSSAAAAVTSLNVEPGGSVVWIARLSLGSAGSSLSFLSYAATSLRSWLASLLGSKVGSDTIARILPLRGSSATTAPCTSGPIALRPSYAACWAAGSRVSSTLPPLGAELLTMSTRRVTKSRESSPESTSFWVRSMPAWE